jgi:hypothetical protein
MLYSFAQKFDIAETAAKRDLKGAESWLTLSSSLMTTNTKPKKCG